jgi:potassium-transporting ATPase KdpC subunit
VIRETVSALLASVVTFALCAVAYPAAVYGLGRTLFPAQAEGSLVRRGDAVVGSALVAQPFAAPQYFQPRPSAAGANGYAADAASGSNLAPTNPALRDRIAADVAKLRAANPGAGDAPIPVDLVTASGSGLDPDISPAAADFQAPRVAAARGWPVERVRDLVAKQTNTSGAIVGAPPRVNVLLLNLELDDQAATPATP